MKEVHDEVMKVVVHEAEIRFVQHFVKNGHSFFSQTLEYSLSFKYILFVEGRHGINRESASKVNS